jgi:alkylation response protein AidB-like acyl-CoA dehydrogenase
VVVEHAVDLDVLLVLHDGGVVAHDVADPDPLEPLDPLTPVGRFTGLGVGSTVGDAETAAHLRVVGTVLSAAMLAGIASRALEVARAYALEREQFGVPIGSFQAVKHMLADMYVRSSLAQSETYAAAVVLGQNDAAAAKLLATDAAMANAAAAVQILGGMGFTWEMLPNYLLKRAWVLEHGFGTADEHALRVGEAIR